jgi:hypothetical protein
MPKFSTLKMEAADSTCKHVQLRNMQPSLSIFVLGLKVEAYAALA